MTSPEISDDHAVSMLAAAAAAAAAAEDLECQLWSKELVKRAKFLWTNGRGRVPTLDEVAREIGHERAAAMLTEIVKRRKFLNTLVGYRSPCHYCNSPNDLVEFDFALMRIQETGRSWGETTASIAIGALTLPLLGIAALKLPGQSLEGQALALKLIVCKPCCKKEGNFFSLFMLNEARASRHPLWSRLREAGFTKFLDSEKMPLALKLRNQTDL